METVDLTGRRLIEIMWPYSDMFRRRWAAIRTLPYDPAFEGEADQAILAMRDRGSTAWEGLSPGAWRVLLERHAQLIMLAWMNEAAGNPIISYPPGLSEDDERVFLALALLLRMKLPWPPADRSSDELPLAPEDWRARGH